MTEEIEAVTIHLSRGLSIFVTDKVKLLCWQPNKRDITADEMWRVHTEDRLKDRIAEKLATKPKEIFGHPVIEVDNLPGNPGLVGLGFFSLPEE